MVTVDIQGLSIRADEVGFWLRAHKGLLRLADEGIASFELDDRGIDVAIDFEVGKDRLEEILSLKKVKAKIHHLSYTLRRSRFSCLAWILKPLLRPLIRKVLERQLSTSIKDGLPTDDPDLYTNVGVTGGATERGNIFTGVYAPGSVVKLWQEEAQQAGERVEDNEVRGWRNEIFDLQARVMQQ
jgi:hypothetical protein